MKLKWAENLIVLFREKLTRSTIVTYIYSVEPFSIINYNVFPRYQCSSYIQVSPFLQLKRNLLSNLVYVVQVYISENNLIVLASLYYNPTPWANNTATTPTIVVVVAITRG